MCVCVCLCVCAHARVCLLDMDPRRNESFVPGLSSPPLEVESTFKVHVLILFLNVCSEFIRVLQRNRPIGWIDGLIH